MNFILWLKKLLGGRETGKEIYKQEIRGTKDNWKEHIQTMGSDTR
jgi:hypothetical protein